MTDPQIRFTRAGDGVRIAYASTGSGPALVRAAHWLGCLDFDGQTPVWQPCIDTLASHCRLTRYDSRGCGLSDREVDSFTLEDMVGDLESVVDAAQLDRFALLGMSQGGAAEIGRAHV